VLPDLLRTAEIIAWGDAGYRDSGAKHCFSGYQKIVQQGLADIAPLHGRMFLGTHHSTNSMLVISRVLRKTSSSGEKRNPRSLARIAIE
jgi:hypothetical protein